MNIDKLRAAQAQPTKVQKPAKPTKPPRSPKARDKAMIAKGRLPDGSHVQAHYLAEGEMWVGHLTVDGTTYSGTADGLFRLMSELDDKYRLAKEKK